MTILLWCGVASATTYYVSNAGTDAAGCTTPATACRTLAYVDSSIALNAGDSVLLQRGGVWNEQLIATASGTSGSPITYDAYGTGTAPLLTPTINLAGATWTHNSGNIYTTPLTTTIVSPQITNLQLGSVWGRKRSVNPGCASAGVILGFGDFCVVYPTLYVYSPNGTLPSAYYSSIVPVVGQASGLAVVSIVGRSWLTFQHIAIQNFDYMGVSVTGASDNLVFANMEVDGMIPYGATPLGFYVNATNPGNIQFLNDDAHLNYSGFKFDGTATAISVTNCRGYANRAAGLSDNTGAATYSYSHFYGNNVAELLATDVVGGIAGSGNVGLVCGAAAVLPAGMCLSTVAPVAVNFKTYPARFSFTVDDVGSSSSPPGTEAYINTFLTMFTSRGLFFNAAVVPSYTVDWVSVNNWYAAGNEIDSHSWSHQYYSTQTNPQNVTPYANYPALDMQYTGSGTAATLTIGGSPLTLSTSVTGGSGDSISPVNLTVSPYNTMAGLATYLMSVAHYSVTYDNGGTVVSQDGIGPVVRPNTHTTNLLNVAGQDIKSAAFKLVYDQTKLEPDEMTSSKSAMQSNVSGLAETFYVYPAGIEDPTIEADAIAAGYTAARGSLSMKDQTNQTVGANSLYSNGVNVQNLTSLAAVQIHGLTQGQISQMAASLVFRAAAWGAPYGFFTHWNSRGDSTPDISNAELGYLLDAVTANGGVWLTNMGLASAVTSSPAIAISGTTRYVQNPTGAAVNLAVAGANSPTVGRGVVTGYPIDLRGTNRSALGAWDIGASAYLSQRYGSGSGTGTTHIGGLAVQGAVQLPQNWVNSNERTGTTSRTINVPSTGTGGGWTCGATNYGPYTAGSQASLQQAINDAESCRTANGSGTTIAIPPAVYSGSSGLTLPQTAGDASSNFILLTSTNPLPTGQTVCSHGIQDNIAEATQPGVRNLGCTGASMNYQIGPNLTTVPVGAFTLANGSGQNTSQYNDIASMWTVECTSSNCNAIQTASADTNGVGPHHFVILNAELRPVAGLAGPAAPVQLGAGTESLVSQIPTHIHLAYSYLHGDWTDAPMTGCPSACVATAGPTGTNNLPNLVAVNACIYCSVMYNYMDRALRPGSEGHGISVQLGQQLKIAHNWIEGQSIGLLCGGQAAQIAITGFVGCQDVEDRGNRYTYPLSWILANGSGTLRQVTKNGAGVGSGYLAGDVVSIVEAGGSGGTATVNTVGAGGTLLTMTPLVLGSGYSIGSGVSVTGGSGTGGLVNITTGYFPNGGTTNNYVRKNGHEMKVGERYVFDGNIVENVDGSGAQNGTVMSVKTDNNSSLSAVSNWWVIDENTTITNNLLRGSCNGPSWGYRSNTVGGDGNGTSFPTQKALYQNNLLYWYGITMTGCAGVSPQFGFRFASGGTAAIWPTGQVTATRNAAGTMVTLTLTASSNPDLSVSSTNVGDPVNVYGCTTDTTMNTGNSNLGPPALTGTLAAGLTVVYASVGPANSVDATCNYNNGQGWPNYLTFNHNSDFATNSASANDPESSSLGGTNPYAFVRNATFTNSIIAGGGINSTFAEGTRTETKALDATTEAFNNTLMPGRDAAVTCPGHATAGAGGMAACYTEYSSSHVAATPVTLYGTPSANCTGNDPTVGSCSGIVGAMSTSGFPVVLNDWHLYRLCHAGDAACNNNASLYAGGGIYQATDGSDLGVATLGIDAAETRNIYPCASACGTTGPYADH